jgi:hypothetical protein
MYPAPRGMRGGKGLTGDRPTESCKCGTPLTRQQPPDGATASTCTVGGHWQQSRRSDHGHSRRRSTNIARHRNTPISRTCEQIGEDLLPLNRAVLHG